MKKLSIIIIMTLSYFSSYANISSGDSVFGTYFMYLISEDGWYNYNECRGKISGNLFLLILNKDSTFSSRTYSLSETCTFKVCKCDTTIGSFQHESENEIILQSTEKERGMKYGTYPCNAYRGNVFYVFNNKISDLINDEFAYNGFSNYDKVIEREKDKGNIINLKTFYKKEITDGNKDLISIYKGIYYKFEIDTTTSGKIGVFKLLKLNDDKTFEYKFFQVFNDSVLRLDSNTYNKGNYEYVSEHIIKIDIR